MPNLTTLEALSVKVWIINNYLLFWKLIIYYCGVLYNSGLRISPAGKHIGIISDLKTFKPRKMIILTQKIFQRGYLIPSASDTA